MKKILTMLATAALLVAGVVSVAPAAVARGSVEKRAATQVSFWGMDETSGKLMHDGIDSNTGTLFNVALGQPGRTGSGSDHSFGFNGTSSHVIVPTASNLDPGSADVTVTAWVKFTAMPGGGNFDFDILRKSGYKIEIWPRTKKAEPQCVYNGTGGHALLFAPISINDGAWHQITCTKTATMISLTVDAQTWSSAVALGSLRTKGKELDIGWQDASADFYNGLMDDVSISIG